MISKLLRWLCGRCTHVLRNVAGSAPWARLGRVRPSRAGPAPRIALVRLSEVAPEAIIAHMSDPRVTGHMQPADFEWTAQSCADFVVAKEACWERDGLGHWAILSDGVYVGWGGFQKEAGEWEFDLVLHPDSLGQSVPIARQVLGRARRDPHIPFVTFRLPPSGLDLRGLARLDARYLGPVVRDGVRSMKFRLDMA